MPALGGNNRAPGSTNRPQSQETADAPKIYRPIAADGTWGRGWHESSKGVYGQTNTSGSVHWHSGIDYGVDEGTPCVAPVDGKIVMATSNWSDGGMVHFQFTKDTGNIKAGTIIGWGHCKSIRVSAGQKVKAGKTLALSGSPGGGPHVHFVVILPGQSSPGGDGKSDPVPILKTLQKGEADPIDGGGDPTGPTTDTTDGTGGDSEVLAKATAFATFLEMPSILTQTESIQLGGQRSLQNDQPLFPFVQQICQASLRSFQSMPNGNFFAFFPDYFGSFNWRTPYWEIHDIEIIEGNIQLSDDALATHVFVIGDVVSIGAPGLDFLDKLSSSVISVLNAFMTGFLNENPDVTQGAKDTPGEPTKAQVNSSYPTLAGKQEALAFLERYGARPFVQPAPMVRHPFYETFLAYQTFMLMWSRQFLTTFEFTYMPELFPGGIVAFPDHGIQCFVEEVSHECDYQGGFKTLARLSAPAAIKTGDANAALDPSRAYVHAGMVSVPRATEN